MKLKKILNRLIIQELESLGKITKPLKVSFDIGMTDHAIDRKYRHLDTGGELIEDDDIIELMDKAVVFLTNKLIEDKLDINDEIVIFNPKNNLNIVGILKNGRNGQINFIIKTIMFKKNFKTNTPKYYIR